MTEKGIYKNFSTITFTLCMHQASTARTFCAVGMTADLTHHNSVMY